MAPLPENRSGLTIFTNDQERIDRFFNDHVTRDEKWIWNVSTKDPKEREYLFRSRGVDFSNVFEDFTSKEDGGLVFHKIFSTFQPGTYLESTFSDIPLNYDIETLAKSAKGLKFYRLGETLHYEYVQSLISG